MLNVASRLKRLSTTHRQGPEPNFFVFATPRSGSTWLAELLATQGRFKIVNEPLNLRKEVVRDNLGITAWDDLLDPAMRPRIRQYLRMFVDGTDRDLRFGREKPLTRFWHPRTDRIIFKMLFGGEDDLPWFERELAGHIIHLLRHPVAVAQSREQLPRLHTYLNSPFAQSFSPAQLAHARRTLDSGDSFQLRILDWCLQNSALLHHQTPDTVVLTYEQLVLEPDIVISYLSERYSLTRPREMLMHVYRASRSTGKSNTESQRILRDSESIQHQRTWLIAKWKESANQVQIQSARSLLEVFEVDVYSATEVYPRLQYAVGNSTLGMATA